MIGLGELVVQIINAIQKADVFLLLIHLGTICILSLIVSAIFFFRQSCIFDKKIENKNLSDYLSDISGFLSAWLFAIFIGSILDGAIVITVAFIVWLRSGAWPNWGALFYIIPIFGVILIPVYVLFLMIGLYYSRDRHDILLP